MPYTLKMIVIFDLRKSQGQFLEHKIKTNPFKINFHMTLYLLQNP